MRRASILAALLALWMASFQARAAQAAAAGEPLLSPGDAAPTFTFSDIDSGVVVPVETFGRGKPLVIVFLQTACRSCYSEMMTLKKLHEGLGGFEVLGVFLDMNPRNFKSYIQDNALTFHFTWDSNNDISGAYGVSFTPATFLLGKDRKIAAVYRGFHPGTEKGLKADIERVARAR